MASPYQTKIKKQYEQAGYKVVKLHRLSENGWPDLMCLRDGRVEFVEVKEANDTLKLLQMHRIDELIKNGFDAKCLQDGKGQIYP